jgi:hypothetical protein
MNRPGDDEFREFVVGFADPLARLSYLLTVGAAGLNEIDKMTTEALAQVRRHWHDAEATGAPEPFAVEALLCALPHRRRLPNAEAGPPAERLDDTLRAGSEHDSGADVRRDAAGRVGAAGIGPSPGAGDDAGENAAFRRPPAAADGRVAVAVDVQLVRDGMWDAWQGLAPRQRVPLIFADPSVASRRLVGLDVPESFASLRRQDSIGNGSLHDIRSRLRSNPSTRVAVQAMSDREISGLLTETLREHGSTAAPLIDPYPIVTERLRHLRRRAAAAVVLVVLLLAGGTATALQASRPKQPAKSGAAAARDSFHPPALDQRTIAPTDPGLVVNWPTRGNAATDVSLLAKLKADFVQEHPNAIGEVQVLLVADTPAFRLACVTANSGSGVIRAWSFGPIGSTTMVEGAFSYGGRLLSTSVLATAVSDPAGHTELVVIAPPTTDDMTLGNVNSFPPESSPSDQFNAQRLEPLPFANGIAIKDVSTIDSQSLVLSVHVGTLAILRDHVDQAQLTTTGTLPPVEHGTADPAVLAAAITSGEAAKRAGELDSAAQADVLYGGTDSGGTRVVVVRYRTQHLSDLLSVAWAPPPNGSIGSTAWVGGVSPSTVSAPPPSPVQHREYRLRPDTPDIPMVFAYGGTRVGVLVPRDIAKTALVVDGNDFAPVYVDGFGFASMPVAGQFGLLAEQNLRVNLQDSTGHVVRTLQVPSPG